MHLDLSFSFQLDTPSGIQNGTRETRSCTVSIRTLRPVRALRRAGLSLSKQFLTRHRPVVPCSLAENVIVTHQPLRTYERVQVSACMQSTPYLTGPCLSLVLLVCYLQCPRLPVRINVPP